MKKMNILLIAVFALTTGLFSCTKKKPESFVQGQGKDLLAIADYDGKEFDVETLEPLLDQKEAPGLSTGVVTAKEENKSSKMSLVKVKTDTDLLGDTPFLALPHTQKIYKIRYQIKKDHLVLLKVAKKENIHPHELTAAVDLGLKNDLVYIPLVGYPIKGFLNVDNVDQNGEKSNKLTEMSADGVQNAKYFKFDRKGRILFSFVQKINLFTKEYFIGSNQSKPNEWFYSQTITKTHFEDQANEGWLLSQTNKVRFFFNKDEMSAVDIDMDPRIKIEDEENQLKVLRFALTWKDYSRAKDKTENYELKETENESMDWSQKKYFQLSIAGNPDYRLVDLELAHDYFSLTYYIEADKKRIKYSFMRDVGRKAYKPKRQFESDFEKFGFFNTRKHEVNNYEKFEKSDYGKNVFVNRFNPLNKDIKFYFTEGSDEKLIPSAAKACDEWTEAFAKAGLDIKIECVTDPKQRKSLGDVRYNQINLIRSVNESNLFGYGPSVADPRTGEIISATTNMHITSIVSSLVGHIREYILYKAGLNKSFNVISPMFELPGNANVQGDKVSIVAENGQSTSKTEKLLKKFPYLAPNGTLQKLEFKNVDLTEKQKQKKSLNFGREFDMAVTGKYLNQEIDSQCPEIQNVIASIKNNSKTPLNNEIIFACAEKMVPAKMFGTLLHEMGHNFGLRHNFYGSVDKVNFLGKDITQTKEQVRSSSVMEYTSFGEDRLTKVGPYDIAALRYGYNDTIETNQGELPLDPNLSIDDNLSAHGAKRKTYKFCTDEDVEIGDDPLCARHDAGTNPDEVAEHLINEYNDTIMQYNYRMNRQRQISPERLTDYRVKRFWIPLKNIYDQWRYKLADHLGMGNEFLEKYDQSKFQTDIAEKMKTDEDFRNYKNAADRIFRFAMQIATLPPRYCYGDRNGQKSADGKKASVEFADVRRILMATAKAERNDKTDKADNAVPQSCLDPRVKKYIQDKYLFTPETDGEGYELEDVRLDSKIKILGYSFWGQPVMAGPDIIGLMPEKDIAMTVLNVRTPLSYSAMEKRFLPNFMDEPLYRDVMLSYFADRITKGINAKRFMPKDKLNGQDLYLEKFKYEKKSIDTMAWSIFYDGMTVPEKPLATKQRKKKFLVKYTDKKDILDKAKMKVAGLDGTTYYAIMSDEASEAKKLLQMLETIPKRLEAASPLNENTFTGLMEIIESILGKDENIDSTKWAEFFHAILEDEYNEDVCKQAPTGRTKDQQEVDKYRAHWKKVFGSELSLYRAEIQKIYERGTGDGGSGSIAACDMGSLGSWYPIIGEMLVKEMKKKDSQYNLNKKLIVQRIEDYKKVAEKDSKVQNNEDVYNYEELRTQMDMILDILRKMTDY